jgi:hypothetical protein
MHDKTLIAALCVGLFACSSEGPDTAAPTTFTVTVESLSVEHPYFVTGSFTTPVGAAQAGPLLPGDSYSVEFHAAPGMRLAFATMVLVSNDLFLAPDGAGLELFDAQGQPVSGDLTDQIQLWDAGTELDQDLGLGDQQPANQTGPNLGDADANPNVRLASESYPGLPAVADLIGVTLTPGDGNLFTLTLENRSNDQTLMLTDGTTSSVPLSPGVFVILHPETDPLFVAGQPDRPAGLEALAEDGDPTEITAMLDEQSGVVSPVAPGLWVIHGEAEQGELFEPGQPDYGRGLEGLAEDGDPNALLATYGEQANIGVFGGVYGDDFLPLLPGAAFDFELEAVPGERLSFASMFGQSNDLFIGTVPEGVALFNSDGTPRDGADISADLAMWDLGTEVNEYPGAGPNQAPRQSAPNTGPDEGGVVQLVDDGFEHATATELVRVTITVE